MKVALLGPIEVRDDHGRVIELRGARQKAIVACLALHAGSFVPAERLLDEVWDTDVPQGGASALQVQISKLRKILGADAIESSGKSYRLTVARDNVDVHRFDRLLAESRGTAGDAASSALTEALSLWRGDALPGLDGVPFVIAARARLDEARSAATEERFAAELAAGRHNLVADLEQFTSRHPLRERAWELLMIALYRSGRQAEALRAYQTARRHLADELGIEPGDSLRRTERAVLDHDASLDAPSIQVDVTVLATRRTNVVTPATSFVGRHRERTVVDGLLDAHRVVTLVGPGGTGKTRLAIESALARSSRYRDGVWIVELAALREPDQIPTAIATMFGLREFEAANTGTVAPLDRIFEYLAAKELLLVFDNCEHLVAPIADLVARVVAECGAIRVLATSREGLGVSGEMLWPVPPLQLSDAAVLFQARAEAVAPSFEATDAARPLVEEICARLDGLPLAIELAAAKVRTYALPDLVHRLDDRFRLLTGGLRTNLPRQQTLRAVVDWSYDLLDDRERQVFNRMAVFAGGCTLDAAESVCSGGAVDALDVAETIARLVDKSLVFPQHSGLSVRYDLLQTLAHYGRERLASSGEADDARRRHAEYYCRFSDEQEHELRYTGSLDVMQRVAAELQNFRAAMDWAAASDASDLMLRLSTNLTWYWWLAGLPSEGAQRIEAAIALATDDLQRARGMGDVGLLHAFSGDTDRAASRLHECVALARAHHAKEIEAIGCLALAQVLVFRGDIDQAADCCDVADKLFVELEDDWGIGVALIVRSAVRQGQGDFEGCVTGWRECIERFRVTKFGWGLAITLLQLSNVYVMDGELAAGRALLDEAATISREYGFASYELMAMGGQGQIDIASGDLTRAEQRYRELAARARDLVAPWLEAWGLSGLSIVARLRGQVEDAFGYASKAMARMPESFPGDRSTIVLEMGRVRLARGDIDEAVTLLAHATELALGGAALVIATNAGTSLSRALVAAGRPELAAEILGAIDAARAAFKIPKPVLQIVEDREAREAIAAALGDDAATAYAAGSACNINALLERARTA
ncbi:MAG: BTAD domain-containing putative transcriptional regulator [Acidimicrobiia bacterium]